MDPSTRGALIALVFLALSAVLLFLVYVLFCLYDQEPPQALRWVHIFAVDPEQLGFSYSSLVLVSFLSLFLEMLMIRWISSEIRIFAYFKNLVLVACFLGFGLGCYFSRRRLQLMAMVVPLMGIMLFLKLPSSPGRQIIAFLPALIGAGTEVHLWGVPAMPVSWSGTFLALAIIAPLFALIAITFVPMGQLVGWYLEQASNGVSAYTVNVLASLAGILVYTLLCFFYQPPAIWMLVTGVLAIAVFWKQRHWRWILAAVFLACVFLLRIPDDRDTTTYWSPYQKLDLRPFYDNGQIDHYLLSTNSSWYQQIVNLSPEFIQSHPEKFREWPAEWRAYNLPYKFYSAPPSVLVMGSGMGNDVAAALRNGAGRVVAVEIDPLILKLGRDLHFEHPYQSPRTKIVIDDARSYIERSQDRFDLILFSLLDSHTTASHFSNIRIDNFVYTREALLRARQLVSPDGLFVVKFQVDNRWIAGRLYSLLQSTFNQTPVAFRALGSENDTGGEFFITGAQSRIAHAMSNPELAAFVSSHPPTAREYPRLTTDDWPYLYQHAPGVPISVILVSVAVLCTFGWFLRQTSRSEGRIDFHFLLLGAGFMLLEAQIVSRMALLFGTTWLVNSIVVAGLLCLIVAANLLYQRFPKIPLQWAYTGLFASLVVSFFVPLEKLFFESVVLRALVSTLVLCLPVFFAGIVFVSSFARAKFQASVLGSNLFGSLIGGLVESLSLWFGLKSLVVLAALLYAGSALALLRRVRTEEPAIFATAEKL